jgi:hypothetical protein
MKSTLISVLLAALLAGGPVAAEVTDAGAGGFTSVNEALINADRMETWRAAVDDVSRWWNPAHTISGDSHRLSIDAQPQGCFCEDLGDSTGIVHLTVTMVSPGILLRLTGGLGPLGLLGVAGNMTWEFADEEGGTRVTFTYGVGGYYAGGLDEFAGPVDHVTGEALQRLKAYVETGDAERVRRD